MAACSPDRRIVPSPWRAIALAAAGSVALAAQAATIAVPADRPTIQQGIAAARDGDTVLVAPGVYDENIVFEGKAIALASAEGPEVTIIDGGARASVVYIDAREKRGTVLHGFTIRNGRGSGVSIAYASPRVSGNVITGNVGCEGSGIDMLHSSAVITRNRIVGNTDEGCGADAMDGGGISAEAGHPTITENLIALNANGLDGGGIALFGVHKGTRVERNVIRANRAGRYGGGIAVLNSSTPFIAGNVVVDNEADYGGGIGTALSDRAGFLSLFNNTIADNHGRQHGSELYLDGYYRHGSAMNNILRTSHGVSSVYCAAPIRDAFANNLIHATNGATVHGACVSPVGSNGNVDADPLLRDAPNGDYRLQAGSPAIDAGEPMTVTLQRADAGGHARVVDGNGDGIPAIDIGAYEFQP